MCAGSASKMAACASAAFSLRISLCRNASSAASLLVMSMASVTSAFLPSNSIGLEVISTASTRPSLARCRTTPEAMLVESA